jgi:hypothetical protein
MNEYVDAAVRLHRFLLQSFWNDETLTGPDQGVRFNLRFWRFIKGYSAFLPWADDYSYLQAQAYWILGSLRLRDLVGDQALADVAVRCAQGIAKRQDPSGYWLYPNPEWAGRVATVECAFGAIGLLAAYEQTGQGILLDAADRAYQFLVNETGFQKADSGYAINYFQNRVRPLVPNNSTLALALFGRLARVTGDERYLTHCRGMVDFLASAQLETGELPYAIGTQGIKGRPHYQCFQYNAFELIDLAAYHSDTNDAAVLPLIQRLAKYLSSSVRLNGTTRFDCGSSTTQIHYNTAAIAAALLVARRMGLHDALEAENRAYRYVLAQQQSSGGYAFSNREYGVLADRRCYPRPTTMILHHLILKACDLSDETETRQGVTLYG